MNFSSWLQEADIRPFAVADLDLPSLPADAHRLLRDVSRRFPSQNAAYARRDSFNASLELSSHSSGSGPRYADRRIRCLIWSGDLVVNGDLIDDDFQALPVLIVRGNLTVRNWLRGGMPGFIGGSVRAAGFIVGHYNDSPLFVGGDLSATGYVPRAKPYPDLPGVAPHQIAGQIHARQFDALDASEDDLRAAFVDDVLGGDDEGVWVDERAILDRSTAGLAVWR